MHQYLPSSVATFALALVLALSMVSTSQVLAQAEVGMELSSMSEGSFLAFTTEVEGADEKLALNEWRDLMKEYGAKAKRSKPERLKVEEVTINSIGGNDPLSVYADFRERGSQTKVYVWIKHRNEFMSDQSARRDIESAETLLQEYRLRLRRAAINEELSEEQKHLDKVEKKLRNLERDHSSYERDIERAKQAIERAEANIVKNLAAQEETRAELARKAEDVQAVQEKLDNVKG